MHKQDMTLAVAEMESTLTLVTYLAELRFENLPRPVVERTKELFLDWFASVLAGRDAQLEKAVQVLQDEIRNRKPSEVKTAAGSK